MAELTCFGYLPGNSVLHRTDARFKIIAMILLSLVSSKASFPGLGLLTVMLFAVCIHARVPLISGIKELRYFLILLCFVFVARVLSTDGIPAVNFKLFSVSMQGIYAGALICWRLIFIVVLGFAFISTTPPYAIKVAVQWFLKPIPFIPEKKVGVMMGLILRFVPVIFDQAGETAQAQKARGVENRKNPLYRLTKFGFPLMRRTFERADELAVAMEARAFTENRSEPALSVHRRDWFLLTAVGCLCAVILIWQAFVP